MDLLSRLVSEKNAFLQRHLRMNALFDIISRTVQVRSIWRVSYSVLGAALLPFAAIVKNELSDH